MALDHPNLAEGPVSGTTVRERVLRDGPLDRDAVLRIGVELARALAHLHAAGRQAEALSASSVALSPQGRPLFFVEAKPPDGEQGWLSFERSSGRSRPASDIYQLGALLLFALTGREPRQAGLPLELRQDGWAQVEEPLRPILARLLDPRWERRTATALEAAEELDCALRRVATPRQRRRRSAMAAVALCAVGLAAGAAVYRSAGPRRPASPRPVPVRAREPGFAQPRLDAARWVAVDGVYPDVMEVQSLLQGVWIITKYSAIWLPNDRRLTGTLLSNQGSSYATGAGTAGEVFLGGWEGEMWRSRLDGAPCRAPPAFNGKRRVDALALSGGTLYAAWQGYLWSWKDGDASWTHLPVPSGNNLTAVLAAREGTLWAGGRGGLWRRENEGWRLIWKGEKHEEEVVRLLETLRGRIFVGTRDGYFTVENGQVSERELRGHWVRAFAESPQGGAWAGTWDEGLFFLDNGLWRPASLGAKYPSVSGVVADNTGLLWVGVYGSGAYVRSDGAARGALP